MSATQVSDPAIAPEKGRRSQLQDTNAGLAKAITLLARFDSRARHLEARRATG